MDVNYIPYKFVLRYIYLKFNLIVVIQVLDIQLTE